MSTFSIAIQVTDNADAKSGTVTVIGKTDDRETVSFPFTFRTASEKKRLVRTGLQQGNRWLESQVIGQ